MLSTKNTGAIVSGSRSNKGAKSMKVIITRQTFIEGKLVESGDVVDVSANDYYGNLINKAVPVPTAAEKNKAATIARAKKAAKTKARAAAGKKK